MFSLFWKLGNAMIGCMRLGEMTPTKWKKFSAQSAHIGGTCYSDLT
jgi:hypothetical protein